MRRNPPLRHLVMHHIQQEKALGGVSGLVREWMGGAAVRNRDMALLDADLGDNCH
ncbi:hypothetical protein HMPREF0240_01598 [Clostridium sp. D5]|nr:hypothetical protein HMPREF0240_01598 [Clostridium sp. D5]